jgi:hypothetical protein
MTAAVMAVAQPVAQRGGEHAAALRHFGFFVVIDATP